MIKIKGYLFLSDITFLRFALTEDNQENFVLYRGLISYQYDIHIDLILLLSTY